MTNRDPILKWAGGKRWILPYLVPLIKGIPFTRLVEPFCGGMAVGLGLQPAAALMNDINPHLINFYRWVAQTGLPIDMPFVNQKVEYYQSRERFNQLAANPQGSKGREAAQLLYYLNRSGFKGLMRWNQNNQFNVPYGEYRRIEYAEDFLEYQPLLQGWEFSCVDFAALEVRQGDLVYCDSPYDGVEFTQYRGHRFTWKDQERLADWVSGLPCPVILSNEATPRILELYKAKGFTCYQLQHRRKIVVRGKHPTVQEVLAVKL